MRAKQRTPDNGKAKVRESKPKKKVIGTFSFKRESDGVKVKRLTD